MLSDLNEMRKPVLQRYGEQLLQAERTANVKALKRDKLGMFGEYQKGHCDWNIVERE